MSRGSGIPNGGIFFFLDLMPPAWGGVGVFTALWSIHHWQLSQPRDGSQVDLALSQGSTEAHEQNICAGRTLTPLENYSGAGGREGSQVEGEVCKGLRHSSNWRANVAATAGHTVKGVLKR